MHTSPYAQAAPIATENLGLEPISWQHIENWVVDRLAECAGLDPQDIDMALPCTAYGMDSLTGVTLVGDLELWLNISLSPTLFWEMPSIDELVQYLVDRLPVMSGDLVMVDEPDQEWIAGQALSPEIARQLLPQLGKMSDQDVDAMLSRLAA